MNQRRLRRNNHFSSDAASDIGKIPLDRVPTPHQISRNSGVQQLQSISEFAGSLVGVCSLSSWIVNTVPAWLVLLGLVVVIAGGAVAVQKVLRHRYPGLAGDAHNDATRFAFRCSGVGTDVLSAVE